MIGERSPGNTVGPGQGGALGHILETTPDGEQDTGEDVAGLIRGGTATYVTLQRVVQLGDNCFEAVSPLTFGAHLLPMSGTGRILSPFMGPRTHPGTSSC